MGGAMSRFFNRMWIVYATLGNANQVRVSFQFNDILLIIRGSAENPSNCPIWNLKGFCNNYSWLPASTEVQVKFAYFFPTKCKFLPFQNSSCHTRQRHGQLSNLNGENIKIPSQGIFRYNTSRLIWYTFIWHEGSTKSVQMSPVRERKGIYRDRQSSLLKLAKNVGL